MSTTTPRPEMEAIEAKMYGNRCRAVEALHEFYYQKHVAVFDRRPSKCWIQVYLALSYDL